MVRYSKIISFTIKGTPPSITVLSAQDKTYSISDVALNFTVSESASWVGYSLDGKTNVSITESTSQTTYSYGSYNYRIVLTGLAEGPHTLTLYANDTAGNTGTSTPLHFTVTQQTQPQQADVASQHSMPILTVLIIASIVSVTIAAPSLFVYFRKHSRRAETR